MGANRESPAWQQELAPLLKRIAYQRDSQALERLYALTSARLMGLMMRILHDEATSAEQLQELYLKVWYRADQYYQRGSPWGWLCAAARNLAIDRLRADPARHLNSRSIAPLEQIFETQHQGVPWLEQSVVRCLNGLQPKVRQLILLSYIGGYSHAELQTLTRAPLGSIKSRIRRGLRELKRCLE
ncbi:DNA-directed RNA polymerase sigma-70 factor [Marinobacterium zhoushanense]|uniref:DNA-directed RNA polymerase sigma-70 factor n=1 Tax=Marinobacterium zhoushanense TaxID=1679163 RepID=A0ABQ1K7K0_9GAMM|nr:sigma-70 family RNA polymerase sigma factor [Marinobacterium zhoushanense]GGB85865.1 DNA-directed RNA polymerase sigma-70 factor [Marinobacterium zhoushanense]